MERFVLIVSLNTLSIYGGMDEDARAQIASEFDDLADPSQVLVSTYDFVMFGLNLHHGYNVVVMLEEPRNTNTKGWCIGRAFRIR